jgi:cytochrome c-type biogenesis protein CcmH/NrfF
VRIKAIAILGIIILSLLPVYLLYKYLQKVMKPRESMQRFLLWMLTMLLVIFGYTFLLVLIIKLLFPGA